MNGGPSTAVPEFKELSLGIVNDFCVDDRTLVLTATLGPCPTARTRSRTFLAGSWTRARTSALSLLRLLVKFGGSSLPGLIEAFGSALDRGGVAAFESFFHAVHRRFDLALVRAGEFVATVLKHLLRAIHCVVRLIAHLHFFATILIFFRVRFGVLAHLLDFIFRETAAGRDRNLLLFTRAKVFGVHVQNAIRID